MSVYARSRAATAETRRTAMSKSMKKSTKQVKTTKGTAKPKAERKPAANVKPKRLNALDAAAQVLRKSGQAMRATEMIAAMGAQG